MAKRRKFNSKSGKGGRKSKRGKKGYRKGGRKRKSSGKVSRIIKEMKDMTTPITTVYNWAQRWQQNNPANTAATTYQMVFPVLAWNDSYDIAPLHNNLQVQLNVPSPGAAPLTKFAVGNYQAQFTLKNLSNMDCTYDIYTVVARDDISYQEIISASWAGTITYANFLYKAFQGLIEMGFGSINNFNFPMALTMYDIPKFCSYFKILKCKKNNLLIGGGFKTYMVNDKKWRLWDGEKIYQANGATNVTDSVFGRRSKMVFILARGQPVADATSSSSVAIAPVNIAISGTERYQFTGMNLTQKKLYMTNDYGTVATMSTVDLQTEIKAGYVIA